MDLAAPRHRRQVLLSSFTKASVTEWQLEHVGRVMATLERQPGVFQGLLQIWDAGNSWVLVQELQPHWTPLREKFSDPATFTEEKLRHAVFQVAALVHFLHRYGLSLAGELVHYDLMMANEQLTLLLHLDLILSGCILVQATKKNRAADVAAIGMLMFQLAMMPRSLKKEVDIRYVEGAIEDQLEHLSSPCQAILLDCLSMKLTVQDLLARKWLRQVDFLHMTHKLDLALSTPEVRSALYNSLMWKLAALCMMDWLRRMHEVPEVKRTEEEEETESSRQRNRRPTRRIYTRSRLYIPNGMLRRGPLPVPVPAGHSLLPQGDFDTKEQRRHLYALPPDNNLHEEPESIWRTYDNFDYNFPSFYTRPEAVLYDDFDFDDDFERLSDGEGEFISLPTKDRRSSMSSGDDCRSLQREAVRSLQHAPVEKMTEDILPVFDDTFKHRSSVEHGHNVFGYDGSASHDAVHFSAFGPAQISFCDFFRVDIWAFLKQQRESMLEVALEQNDVETGHRVQPLHIQRGMLVTVSIEPSPRFGVKGEGCKSFRWRGDITGVSFDLFRRSVRSVDEKDDENDELCIAKIVAGTKVSLLYIRLHASASHTTGSSPDLGILDTHMEHVAPNVLDIPEEDLELIRPIGHGAFGDAVLARWKSTSKDVVVKMMNHDVYRSADALAEFQHEAAVMNLLGKHPHVVELLGVSSGLHSSQSISLVTEYLPNGSVEDVLGISHPETSSATSLSLFSRTVMARDAAHGLANIHQGSFLHCDVAARNCLVDSDFSVKVCDFGLSRRLNGTSSGFLFDDDRHGYGPLKWMAPESLTPPHLFSTYSDSYMFGVLLYEIFSGHPPFPNLSSRDAAALILEGHHVPVPLSLPATHQKLMEECFQVHPLRRPSMDQIYSTLNKSASELDQIR
ncbi:hypothetical protein V7S43_000292 [Phytophthora oleae]|uniref:Protein kinase domain-containing protein n=1 Tax=Phytophthora oleae TaxID=2107226 RepID=A0ABD3G8T2_9STRA